jgi:hypothetical protein
LKETPKKSCWGHLAGTSDEIIIVRHEVDMVVVLHKKDFEKKMINLFTCLDKIKNEVVEL